MVKLYAIRTLFEGFQDKMTAMFVDPHQELIKVCDENDLKIGNGNAYFEAEIWKMKWTITTLMNDGIHLYCPRQASPRSQTSKTVPCSCIGLRRFESEFFPGRYFRCSPSQ